MMKNSILRFFPEFDDSFAGTKCLQQIKMSKLLHGMSGKPQEELHKLITSRSQV